MKYVAVYSYQNKFYPEVWKTFGHKIDKHLRVLVGYPAMQGTRELLFKMTDIFFEKVFKPYMGDEFFEITKTRYGYDLGKYCTVEGETGRKYWKEYLNRGDYNEL